MGYVEVTVILGLNFSLLKDNKNKTKVHSVTEHIKKSTLPELKTVVHLAHVKKHKQRIFLSMKYGFHVNNYVNYLNYGNLRQYHDLCVVRSQ